jgi:MFS family permease
MTEAPRPQPSTLYRWTVLLFISVAMGGNYYIYDSINALEQIFKDQLGFTSSSFAWLNKSYSLAALATLLIGGIVIDRIGTKKAIAVFGTLCLLGAMLTASQGSVAWMVTGRAVLGLGAESMIVAVTAALAKWFKGKELSFAFGINLTIARLASVAADNSPSWAHWAFYPNGPNLPASWQKPMFVAVGAGVLCVVTALVYWSLEAHAERKFSLGQAGSIDKIEFGEMSRIRGLSLRQAALKIWRALVEFVRFNPSYWFVVILCFTFYSAIFPFRTFAIEFFTNKILSGMGGTGASEVMRVSALQQAGFLNSLLPLSAMIATPLFGLLVDRVGKRALLMMLGSVLLMPVYLMMAYLSAARMISFSLPWLVNWHFSWIHVTLPVLLLSTMSMMGISFSLIPAVMWPSVAYIVDQKRIGTAYALMTFIQQIGFFALNDAIGRSNDATHASLANPGGYALGMWIFSVLGFVGLAFAILLRLRETGPHGHGLETIRAGA